MAERRARPRLNGPYEGCWEEAGTEPGPVYPGSTCVDAELNPRRGIRLVEFRGGAACLLNTVATRLPG